ncbi:Major facilitator superfamily protein [Citrus sinensis]|uniref:Major facilitator superfamily protein n=1 Tax=Citrus sinensis TaxID=2711 RepID=A0ACB8KY94_CITSI|nr:Major facilitator superfamily protein [Citrus sinensis]
MVAPAITDVTMSAVCPGRDECSLAIYLSGFQQAIIGLGTLVMMPLVGNLSDKYGRKALLTVPITLSIIPLAILAYSRSRNFFYAYYVLRTLTAMVCEGSIHCLSLAYVADNVPPGRRASVFGIFSGIVSGAFVCGTISARFISTSAAFQAATAGSIISAVYMRIFLPESVRDEDLYTPILSSKAEISASCEESTKKLQVFKRLPSIDDMVHLLKSSPTFSQAAIVAFLSNLADAGLQGSMMYYLKAKFHFNKNQFADLMVIAGIAGTISQMFLYSVAWSSWVPYAAAVFSILSVFSHPCLRTIVSKQVASNEQGKAQGCISGICSFANLVSPLAFSPLTALFLSDRAPFNFPGFSIMCIGFVSMTAFIQSIMIRVAPPLPVSSQRVSNCNSVVA